MVTGVIELAQGAEESKAFGDFVVGEATKAGVFHGFEIHESGGLVVIAEMAGGMRCNHIVEDVGFEFEEVSFAPVGLEHLPDVEGFGVVLGRESGEELTAELLELTAGLLFLGWEEGAAAAAVHSCILGGSALSGVCFRAV